MSQKTIKFYSIADDELVMNPNVSTRDKALKLDRSEASIYMRHSILKKKINNASASDIAVQRITNVNKPISFTMNGINIKIAGVKNLSIEKGNITIES